MRIQTGKYEHKGSSIPVESRTCLICKENYTEGEQYFLMYCQRYNNLKSELHSLISKSDAHFVTIRVYDKIIYLLNLGNDNTWKLVGKYNYSFNVQKRKEIINTNVIK